MTFQKSYGKNDYCVKIIFTLNCAIKSLYERKNQKINRQWDAQSQSKQSDRYSIQNERFFRRIRLDASKVRDAQACSSGGMAYHTGHAGIWTFTPRFLSSTRGIQTIGIKWATTSKKRTKASSQAYKRNYGVYTRTTRCGPNNICFIVNGQYQKSFWDISSQAKYRTRISQTSKKTLEQSDPLRSMIKNEKNYEVLRSEALEMHKERSRGSHLQQHGLAEWALTSDQKCYSIPLPNKHISTNNKQSELIHVLANMMTHH